ncbi:MAG: KH domain-containing protein [Clostridia bacterium]|nr:KH domain-containing protein [Clostridia bacterium]MDE7328130.1 KH domain-containing protein [Clostridia bacterium]
MEELVRFIVSELVDKKDSFEVTSQVEDGINVINIIAEKEEIGKIIGKQGRIAKAIRTIVKAGSGKDSKKVSVEIIEK